MESYVVRIYRRAQRSVVGVVESPDGAASRPFRDLDELRALLETPATPKGDGGRTKAEGRRKKVETRTLTPVARRFAGASRMKAEG